MSKALSYAVVGVLAFFVGGFAFQLINRSMAETAESKTAGTPKNGNEADTIVPRYYAIEGMTCQSCADNITLALTKIPRVRSAKVSLQDKKAVVFADDSQVSTENILAAITTAGYKGQLASAEQNKPATPTTSSRQPILVNITCGKSELHAVSMALGLAQSAIKDGREAAVFLNVEAPVFVANDLSDDIKFADFPPIKKMLADFIAMGGRVLVCGHCAHIVKIEEGNVIEGAKILAHNELFGTMPLGTVVFSY